MRFADPNASRWKDSFSPLGDPKPRDSKPGPQAHVVGSEPGPDMSPLQNGIRVAYAAGKSSGNVRGGERGGIERHGKWE